MPDWRYYYYEKGTARIHRIKSDWKRAGLKDDADDVMQIYQETNECLICDIPLVEGSTIVHNKKVMDHNHFSGEFRGILCWSCNITEHLKTEKYMDRMNRNLIKYKQEHPEVN